MGDLDLRKLRYFVAVAEHLHFGRAAERLYIAQPVLSRQIRALEQELEVPLFERDRRGTVLTAAGEQLLTDARRLLLDAQAVQRRAVRAARGTDSLTVGFTPGLIVTGPVRALAARHPGLDIELVRTTWDDQITVLHDGRVDIGFVRPPIDTTGLRVRELYTEPRVVVVSIGHRLAGKQSVEIADLAGDVLLQNLDIVPEWRAVAGESERPPVPVYRSVEEKLEHVAAGRGIAFLPLSVATFYTRPDITYIPVSDIADGQVSLAWAADRQGPLIDEFAALAAE
ncbi:LysR family transcriptional regulator [Nocardia sp. NPDC056100]|uniref:LysR family transcriptional regulator n=1 Tax=Nocardia sp. NPDC056100 TaxID=3345712 RepID=UPI0035D681D0